MYETESAKQYGGLMGSGGQALGQQPPSMPTKPPSVHVQIEILDKELGAQREAIEILLSRLNTVLGAEVANDAMAKEGPPNTGCGMANALYEAARQCARNTGTINAILRRLEI